MSDWYTPLPEQDARLLVSFDAVSWPDRHDMISRLVWFRRQMSVALHGLRQARSARSWDSVDGAVDFTSEYRVCDRDDPAWWHEQARMLEEIGVRAHSLSAAFDGMAEIRRSFDTPPGGSTVPAVNSIGEGISNAG